MKTFIFPEKTNEILDQRKFFFLASAEKYHQSNTTELKALKCLISWKGIINIYFLVFLDDWNLRVRGEVCLEVDTKHLFFPLGTIRVFFDLNISCTLSRYWSMTFGELRITICWAFNWKSCRFSLFCSGLLSESLFFYYFFPFFCRWKCRWNFLEHLKRFHEKTWTS